MRLNDVKQHKTDNGFYLLMGFDYERELVLKSNESKPCCMNLKKALNMLVSDHTTPNGLLHRERICSKLFSLRLIPTWLGFFIRRRQQIPQNCPFLETDVGGTYITRN